MKVVSVRMGTEVLAEADRWAERLGVKRAELLRAALAGHLARLRSGTAVSADDAWAFAADDVMLDAADDWGAAENWSDWATAADGRSPPAN